MKYQINGLLKLAEVDNYEEGCDPKSTQMIEVDLTFTDSTVEGVIRKCAEFLGVDNDGIEKNACDEDGRVDFQLMETEESYQPSKSQIEQWKRGTLRLWAVTYTGMVERVETVKI